MEKKVECKVAEDGSRSEVEKTASKLKINHGDCTTTYAFANDKMSIDAKGKAVDDDGWRVDIGGNYEVKQAKGEWKASGSLDIKASDLGGAKMSVNVSLLCILTASSHSCQSSWSFCISMIEIRLRVTAKNKSPPRC